MAWPLPFPCFLWSVNYSELLIGAPTDLTAPRFLRIVDYEREKTSYNFVWLAVPGLADEDGISFEEEANRGHFIRHQDFQFRSASRAEDRDQALFDHDATFIWRPGRAGLASRFESVNFKKHFLRHQNFSIYLHAASEPEPDLLYQYDCSWTLKEAPIF